MTKSSDSIKNLFEAMLYFDNVDDIRNFFIDLCTSSELADLQGRWHVAQLLSTNKFSYREIKEMAGVSATTITRVADFLNNRGYNGYKTLLKNIASNSSCRKHVRRQPNFWPEIKLWGELAIGPMTEIVFHNYQSKIAPGHSGSFYE